VLDCVVDCHQASWYQNTHWRLISANGNLMLTSEQNHCSRRPAFGCLSLYLLCLLWTDSWADKNNFIWRNSGHTIRILPDDKYFEKVETTGKLLNALPLVSNANRFVWYMCLVLQHLNGLMPTFGSLREQRCS